MSRYRRREFKIGDFVSFYHNAYRRRGVIIHIDRLWGDITEYKYTILVLANYLPWSRAWDELKHRYHYYGIRHTNILTKLRPHTVIKYKLTGIDVDNEVLR